MLPLDNAQRGGRAKQCGTKAPPGENRMLFPGDPAKALVMDHIAQIVAAGLAEWGTLSSGDIWVRFRTGETFLLGDKAITRL